MNFPKIIKKLENNKYFYLFLIILIAAFLRFYKLGQLPFGFHNDEVMNAYVGRFILENGKDLYGNPWPILYFNNFGDYPNVIPMYLSGISTLIFGINEFATRFPIALAGTATVALIYLICHQLFKDSKVAILSALSLAILPWHLVLSRATAENITASFFFLLAFHLIFKSIKNENKRNFILSNLLLVGTYLLYPGFRVIVPVASIVSIVLSYKSKLKKPAIFTTIAFFTITLAISQTTWGKGRYDQTSVFSHNNVIAGKALQYSTSLGANRILEARFFHNKIVLAGQEILRQYTSYFSPSFWFNPVGKPSRYLVPEHGQFLYTLTAILLIAILIQFIKPLNSNSMKKIFKKDQWKFFLAYLFLLIISPVSASLTMDDTPNIHRSAVTGILLIFPVALAIAIILNFLKKEKIKDIFIGIFLTILAIEGLFFWHYYSKISNFATMIHRNEDQRALAHWLYQNENQYQKIYLTNNENIELHYLFHKKDFSTELSSQFSLKMKLDQINNIHLFKGDCFGVEDSSGPILEENEIIIVKSTCQFTKRYQLLDQINYIDNNAAYFILEAGDGTVLE